MRDAATVIGINKVEPDRLVTEPNLAGAGSRNVNGLPPQHVGRAFLMNDRCHRHRLPSSFFVTILFSGR